MERIAEELDAAHKELEQEAHDLLTLKEKVKIKLLQTHREGDLKRLAEDMQERSETQKQLKADEKFFDETKVGRGGSVKIKSQSWKIE